MGQYTDSAPALCPILDDLLDVVSPLDLFPEAGYAANCLGWPFHDVVKRHQPSRPHKPGIHLEVGPHSVIGVVAIDKKEIDRTSGEDLKKLRPC